MLDYKTIIIKRYLLHLSGSEIARQMGCSKSGVNDFLRAFEACPKIGFPLPEGITNYGIASIVYDLPNSGSHLRDESFQLPDFPDVHRQMTTRKNMTLLFLWSRYKGRCDADEVKPYSYRQFCDLYTQWCDDNDEDAHFNHVIGQNMEVDFAGKTFELIDPLTGEISTIVVFVAVLPYSQMIYAEGMSSTKEPQWIKVNNHALKFFGGVPAIVTCDNCKQAVVANKDWIAPELNKDYAEWAEHNGTAIMAAKVRKPKYKSSVENAVGILEKGFFHDLEDRRYFKLDAFNNDLWEKLDELNSAPFKKKEHSRAYYWEEEKKELMPLPPAPYEYTERREATVSSDFHVRFDNAYYSVDQHYKHQKVSIRATPLKVRIYTLKGAFIEEHKRATRKNEWVTNPEDLPVGYNNYRDWSADFFINKAMTVGPWTVEVIKRLLKSRSLEVQTYRLCLGVLNYARKYSPQALEECCRQAVDKDRVSYTYIRNTIAGVAEDMNLKNKSRLNQEKNDGAYIMDASAMDVQNLLSKSQKLAQDLRKEDKYR